MLGLVGLFGLAAPLALGGVAGVLAVEPFVPGEVEPVPDIELVGDDGMLVSDDVLEEVLDDDGVFELCALPVALFSATRVCESTVPEAGSPLACWNFFNAALVFGPNLPSTGPALKPLSFSSCWAWLTCELSLEADVDVEMLDCDETLAWEAAGDV